MRHLLFEIWCFAVDSIVNLVIFAVYSSTMCKERWESQSFGDSRWLYLAFVLFISFYTQAKGQRSASLVHERKRRKMKPDTSTSTGSDRGSFTSQMVSLHASENEVNLNTKRLSVHEHFTWWTNPRHKHNHCPAKALWTQRAFLVLWWYFPTPANTYQKYDQRTNLVRTVL